MEDNSEKMAMEYFFDGSSTCELEPTLTFLQLTQEY